MDKIGDFTAFLYSPGIVDNVVVRCNSQQYQIGRVLPDVFAQSQQLLPGTVTGHAKVEHLDSHWLSGRRLRRQFCFTGLQLVLQNPPECLLQRHLQGFAIRIAEDRYSEVSEGFALVCSRPRRPSLFILTKLLPPCDTSLPFLAARHNRVIDLIDKTLERSSLPSVATTR